MTGLRPTEIFGEYEAAMRFKNSLGNKGLYEQSRINERFYRGDQWYGAGCGNERPLVRHNVIKRIGDYKMSQILSENTQVQYYAKGIPALADKTKQQSGKYSGEVTDGEINSVMKILSMYRDFTAKRSGLDSMFAKLLKNAYISGTGVMYTYFDGDISTGTYTENNDVEITGDIKSEVLRIEDVYFSDPFVTDTESQKYIIISSVRDVADVIREAKTYGADEITLSRIVPDRNGKIKVLTKLYKEYKDNGEYTVKCIKVTEKAVVRDSFDTRLRRYPLCTFCWEDSDNCAYGNSEVTYLIPNQIAINRMITANVWSAVSMGMPMMVVNGDTVADGITNDPGQIIKIYGTNEDVAGAVKYVAPPDACLNFGTGIESLINNTLIQSGANEVALGDCRPDNASALEAMRYAATLPLAIMKKRFATFIEQLSLIWADFWIMLYGQRKLCYESVDGVEYVWFDAERYRKLRLAASVSEKTEGQHTDKDILDVLNNLLDRGIINKRQYIARLPKGLLKDADAILEEETVDDGV